MHWRAYRLALEDSPLARVAREIRDMAHPGDPSPPEACVAYESAELAALCTPELLWTVRRRTDMLREALQLPAGDDLHERLPASRFGTYDPEATDTRTVMAYMVQRRLLSCWMPCAVAPAQHAVLVNALHPAFDQIAADRRLLVHTRPLWSGHFAVDEAAGPADGTKMSLRTTRRRVVAPLA